MADTAVAEARATVAMVSRDILDLADSRTSNRSPDLIERVSRLLQKIDTLTGRIRQAGHDNPEIEETMIVVRALRRVLYLLMVQINPDQAWFWTEEWQAGEHRVDAYLASHQIDKAYTEEEFDVALCAAQA